jgi:hypothetical protein
MSLTTELIKDLLPEEEKKKVVAVYGGGFKPPTKGHFAVVKQAISENENIDEFIILVGGKDRDGVTQSDSIMIWDIYKKYLPIIVTVESTSTPPIKAIYNYAKEHPNEEVLFIIGAREGNEEDFSDISNRTKSLDKYSNLELRTIVTQGGVSGTAARNAAKISVEKLSPFLPDELTDKEEIEVYDIVSPNLREGASYSQDIDIKQKIKDLTQHMLDKDMNIQPLPKVIFKHGNVPNAKEFMGKTAYYDPNTMTIVLYTEGRHPKDIVRSFSHEMVHHTQNIEDRLGDIQTTNTQEDDHLDKIEQEANLIGTMTFRNWTDSLNEAIVGDKVVCDNCGWSWDILDGGDDVYICHKCGHDNTPINEDKESYKHKHGFNDKLGKDPFGINAFARELAMGLEENEEDNYKIYVDMDGVVADFEKRFEDLAGMGANEFKDKYGTKEFWDLIDEKNKVSFWRGIEPMIDAQTLMDFVSKHDYEMLTAPSIKKQSVIGKSLWIKDKTGKLFPSTPKVNYKSAKQKHLIKPKLTAFDILIDDKQDTIDRWNSAGGTGILHTSANNTITQLEKLKLYGSR